jgi:hypothetical protein
VRSQSDCGISDPPSFDGLLPATGFLEPPSQCSDCAWLSGVEETVKLIVPSFESFTVAVVLRQKGQAVKAQ